MASDALILEWANATGKTNTGPGTPLVNLPVSAMADIADAVERGLPIRVEERTGRRCKIRVLVSAER